MQCRRDDGNARDNFGITGNLVVRLMDRFQDQNYIVYKDRFYTSVKLWEFLLKSHGTRLIGTAMTNRQNFSNQLIRL